MKKTYEVPTAEKMEFSYRDQVVVASNNVSCKEVIQKEGPIDSLTCSSPEQVYNYFS